MPRHNDFYDLLNSNNVPNSSQAASVKQTINGLSKSQGRLFEPGKANSALWKESGNNFEQSFLQEMLRDLGRVCKSWQNASLLAHQLWSGLQLIRPPEDGAYGRMVSWLNRSGALPKTLQFDGSGCECTSEEVPCLLTNPELLKLLTTGPSLDHFELLSIHVGCFVNWIDAINSAKKSLSGPCPWDTLRSFRLQCPYQEGREWDEPFVFQHLPFVASLNIEFPSDLVVGVEGDGDPMVIIPVKLLNQLTTFAIELDWYGTEIFSLLESCKNLETLTITCGSRFDLFDEREPKLLGLAKSRVVLPKVQKFSIGRSETSSILKYLAMPALSDLDLDLEYGRIVDDKFGATLHDFFRASNASEGLQALRISNTDVPAADLRHCLSNLPLLKGLTLQWVEFGDKLFETTGENQDLVISPNLPSLEHLKLLSLPRTYEYQSELRDFTPDHGRILQPIYKTGPEKSRRTSQSHIFSTIVVVVRKQTVGCIIRAHRLGSPDGTALQESKKWAQNT
ncbi:hypothetical protein D9611_009501 [Ephemerocybe angulata]|uniref:Uncharacterized protein n=1 Tax=Ephemerocybe angulata TaxID=980116 RepID=A0A8H5AV72_9AGAR|nr:hypothetical protein D9611_009501 [Tulosesus angulatus]